MRQFLKGVNRYDDKGNPAGGYVKGVGINIGWQDGPLGNPPDLSKHNGAFIEGVIESAIGRLRFFQESKFKCKENEDAIYFLEQALVSLDSRTKDRKDRNVEGTHNA